MSCTSVTACHTRSCDVSPRCRVASPCHFPQTSNEMPTTSRHERRTSSRICALRIPRIKLLQPDVGKLIRPPFALGLAAEGLPRRGATSLQRSRQAARCGWPSRVTIGCLIGEGMVSVCFSSFFCSRCMRRPYLHTLLSHRLVPVFTPQVVERRQRSVRNGRRVETVPAPLVKFLCTCCQFLPIFEPGVEVIESLISAVFSGSVVGSIFQVYCSVELQLARSLSLYQDLLINSMMSLIHLVNKVRLLLCVKFADVARVCAAGSISSSPRCPASHSAAKLFSRSPFDLPSYNSEAVRRVSESLALSATCD
jgi:hypothetical protein